MTRPNHSRSCWEMAPVKRAFYTFVLLFAIPLINARKHKLVIKNDGRQDIDMSTFGFLPKGSLEVVVTKFMFKNKKDLPAYNTFGFTLDKTASSAMNPLNSKTVCALQQKEKKDIGNVMFFRMDFTNNTLHIERHGDLQNVSVSTTNMDSSHRSKREAPVFSDTRLYAVMGSRRKRTKRSADEGTSTQPTEKSGHKTSTLPLVSPTPTKMSQSLSNIKWELVKGNKINIFKKIDKKLEQDIYSFAFKVKLQEPKQQGLYNLYFRDCGAANGLAYVINLTASMVEYNDGNYLSAGEQPLPHLYFSLCVVFFLLGCYWWHYIRTSQEGVFKIHYLMLVLIYFKSASLLFHGVHFYFIAKEGHHAEAFSIIYYITHLMKGALLFITVVLIGAGWTYIKYILSDRDKKIFLVVIPLQVLANVAQIIIEETEEGQSQYFVWKQVLMLVDLICCGTILFPVVWSIRHLQEASGTDGKAAINLEKLKIFRHFYIVIVCYIYFTRIIVYLLQITLPFQYAWIYELFKELATVVFFVITGYKFRPTTTNPYLQVSQDSDDEVEMEQVVTTSGAYEGLHKVNVKYEDGKGTKPKQRESSHEYD